MINWRASMGFSQHDAAEALGCSRSIIAMIESGSRRLDRRTEYACRWLAAQQDPRPDTRPGPRDEIAELREEIRALRALVSGGDDLDAAKARARITGE